MIPHPAILRYRRTPMMMMMIIIGRGGFWGPLLFSGSYCFAFRLYQLPRNSISGFRSSPLDASLSQTHAHSHMSCCGEAAFTSGYMTAQMTWPDFGAPRKSVGQGFFPFSNGMNKILSSAFKRRRRDGITFAWKALNLHGSRLGFPHQSLRCQGVNWFSGLLMVFFSECCRLTLVTFLLISLTSLPSFFYTKYVLNFFVFKYVCTIFFIKFLTKSFSLWICVNFDHWSPGFGDISKFRREPQQRISNLFNCNSDFD